MLSGSIESTSDFEATSARPMPMALPWLAGVRLRTQMAPTSERRVANGRPSTPRPMMLVSMPAPEMSLPIASMTRTSMRGKGSAGIRARASASSAASRSANRRRRDRLDPRELMEAVLDDADRSHHLHVAEDHLRDRRQHGLEAEASGGAVTGGRAFRAAEADRRHLQDAAAEPRALEVGVRLDAVDEDHAVGGERFLRDVDRRAGRRVADQRACPCADGSARRRSLR